MLRAGLCAFATASVARAESAEMFQRIEEFRLENGMRFVVLPVAGVPSVTIHMFVEAGDVDDPPGRPGLAAKFRGLYLMGPETIGSKSAEAEAAARRTVEAISERLDQERLKAPDGFSIGAQTAEADLQFALGKLEELGDSQAFLGIQRQHGFISNAVILADASHFQWTLPSNRTEIWFKLYGEWLQKPAFRGFYRRQDAAKPEASRAGERSEWARHLLDAVFKDHPYGRLAVETSSGASLQLSHAKQFLQTNYSANRITVALVGDVGAKQARQFAAQYFGKIPAHGGVESGERKAALPGEPLRLHKAGRSGAAIGFLRSAHGDAGDLFFAVLDRLWQTGTESELFQDLVVTRRLAESVHVEANLPGGRWESLFVLYGAAAARVQVEDLETALLEVVEEVRVKRVEPARLKQAVNRMRSSLLQQFLSSEGAATLLARTAARRESARKLGEDLERLKAMTPESFQQAAQLYLKPENRIVLVMTPTGPQRQEAGKQ